MGDPTRQTRSQLMQLFNEEGLFPRGDLGQNFLIDLNLLELIVRAAELGTDDVVLEVGTGTGGLTGFLFDSGATIITVEYDPNMYRLAREKLPQSPRLIMIEGDALKNKNQISPIVIEAVSTALAADPFRQLKLVANLPYHAGTPVIANLIASELNWERMVVTVQKEMAERMLAKPSTSDYSALSVWVQSQSQVEILRKLPPSVFWPRPQVDSAIVRIIAEPEKRQAIGDRLGFQAFVRDIFTQRRKALRGVMSKLYSHKKKGLQDGPVFSVETMEQIFTEFGLKPEQRAEELEPTQLCSLWNLLEAAIKNAGNRSVQTTDLNGSNHESDE